MIDPESQKILIAGAGPAGAALAQVLRKYDIPYEIFEREDVINSRRGGAFLIDTGLEALEPHLPSDLKDPRMASSNSATGEQDVIGFVDGKTSTLIAKTKGIPYGQPGFALSARRADFRAWLLEHLPIQTGKRVSRYEEDIGGVTVHFTDGTTSRGAMLIGADGSNSTIRNQLLENPAKELNSIVPITGEVELQRHAYLPLLQCGSAGFVCYTENGVFGAWRISVEPDGSSARYWWLASFKSEDPPADVAWVQAATPRSLLKKALSVTENMPSFMTDLVRRTGEAGIWQPQIKFTEWVPPKALPRGRVTLVGDAAHNTTPFGGMGANTGLMDAADLGRLINEHIQEHGSIRDRGDVDWILKRYEDVMLPRGRNLVLNSREASTGKSNQSKTFGREHVMETVSEPLMTDWIVAPSPPAHD